jgi:hypothetical protein
MEDARSYMAEMLRTLADKLDSTTDPATLVEMSANNFTVSLTEAVISVTANPAGSALVPPFQM